MLSSTAYNPVASGKAIGCYPSTRKVLSIMLRVI